MSKLFYSDPLKAAYMSREFGVEYMEECNGDIAKVTVEVEQYEWLNPGGITSPDQKYIQINVKFSAPMVTAHSVDNGKTWTPEYFDKIWTQYKLYPKYYIHPDSLHIFDPKEGDVVVNPNGYPYLVSGGDMAEFYENEISVDEAKDWVNGNWKIIQRDNKAFFAPEVEV